MYILRPYTVVPSPIDDWQSLAASLSPASAILPLPDRQEPSAEVENGCAAGFGFRLWTASPDSFSRHSQITSTFNRFRTAQKPRDKPWLDGYRRVLSTAAQGKLLIPERRAP